VLEVAQVPVRVLGDYGDVCIVSVSHYCMCLREVGGVVEPEEGKGKI